MANPTPALETEPVSTPANPHEPAGPVAPTAAPTEAPEAREDKESWGFLISKKSEQPIKERFAKEATAILESHGLLKAYCCLALFEPADSINAYDLDQIYDGLQAANPDKDRDVLLMLLSHGGAIEPAYQISKLCKAFAKNKFVVAVPRQAKSAATLIALGADEIHMSVLGQLGPIDPQLGGLPALGVAQALQRIAALAEKFPGSAEMFSKYLQLALTVEQIGYCDRIAESAEQYAQRLLAAKTSLRDNAAAIAKEMVHTYKDHGFVIDLAEAREHLGKDWVKDDTPEVSAAEEIYSLFTRVNTIAGWFMNKRMLLLGRLDAPNDILFTVKQS
jgi:ClpP class serine protease